MRPYTIFPLGEHALQLELAGDPDPASNQRLHATRTRLLAGRVPGVLDVLAAYTTLTVYYDPWAVRRALPVGAAPAHAYIGKKLRAAYAEAEAEGGWPGRLHTIAVRYGGYDLPAVAAALGRTEAEVIALHTASEYYVYLIGFLPGFPYLGPLPGSLVLPRKAQPVSVPAGAVAIAGRQTGIYPVASPGGWHVLGRTEMRLFDPGATPPVRIEPGDRVRFMKI